MSQEEQGRQSRNGKRTSSQRKQSSRVLVNNDENSSPIFDLSENGSVQRSNILTDAKRSRVRHGSSVSLSALTDVTNVIPPHDVCASNEKLQNIVHVPRSAASNTIYVPPLIQSVSNVPYYCNRDGNLNVASTQSSCVTKAQYQHSLIRGSSSSTQSSVSLLQETRINKASQGIHQINNSDASKDVESRAYKEITRYNKSYRKSIIYTKRWCKMNKLDYNLYKQFYPDTGIRYTGVDDFIIYLSEKRIKKLLDKSTIPPRGQFTKPPVIVPSVTVTITDIPESSSAREARVARAKNLKNLCEKQDRAAKRRNGVQVVGYNDMGDANYLCLYCGALLWFGEKVKNTPAGSPEFAVCCSRGKIKLPNLGQPPKLLYELLTKRHPKSPNFVEHIRAYNMMYAFTSMSGIQDNSVNSGKGPYSYRLGGQNYHRIGDLKPGDGNKPKFAQLYMFCSEDETKERIDAIRSKNPAVLDPEIVTSLRNMIDEHNPIAKNFRMAAEHFRENPENDVKLCLIGRRSRDGRMYNLPTCSEVAALIVGNSEYDVDPRDIVLHEKSGNLMRISELHPSYLPMQYPLLFPYGEDGYHTDIRHTNKSVGVRNTVTMKEFLSFRIFDRREEATTLLLGRKLFQQFLVDGYMMMESQRLSFIMRNQKQLRAENYKFIEEAIRRGEMDGEDPAGGVGRRYVLPSTFVGGPRYMIQNFQDTMAICRNLGYPELFITFTCNPKWPEVTRHLDDMDLKPADRPDIVARIFKMKLDQLIKDLKTENIFGKSTGVVYTIEFQKRGLPHAHILLWIERQDKNVTTKDIDDVISAEIPDENVNPDLYGAVAEYMIHGPCGPLYPGSPCMHDGKKCSKKFPKTFNEQTSFDGNGYPVYRRRNTGATIDKNGTLIDNGYIVPYNPYLLMKYQAHINVEWCNKTNAIKYLFKYVNKGIDRIGAKITVDNEVKDYVDCRYISACEAVWRIIGYEIHYRDPPVERLSIHLPGEQNIYFKDGDLIQDLMYKPTISETKFLKWMEYNKNHENSCIYLYTEFPRHYVWDPKVKNWKPRKQRSNKVGRIYHVPPSCGSLYYLRIMLNHVRGATCYEDLRTVNGTSHPTYRDACYAMGLLDDDKEYIDGIQDAFWWGSGRYLRQLFCILLMSNSMSQPNHVWESTWTCLGDDIQFNLRRKLKKDDLVLTEEQVKNFTLVEIEELLSRNGTSLRNFEGMPVPNNSVVKNGLNILIAEETSYDVHEMQAEFDRLFPCLTDEQRNVYETIMSSISSGGGGVFFLYGYGGTGKTFLWKTLCSALRGKGDIVLPVASSGIASLLLPRGRTAHSRFGIPLIVDESTMCRITPGSDIAGLLQNTKLIIWDEAPMTNRFCFEALDRSLRDIMRGNDGNCIDKPFGGMVIVFGGDFRQILPVVPKGSRSDIVNASLCSSRKVWSFCKVLKLTKNMRLQCGGTETEIQEIKEFADWLLHVGDGEVGDSNDGEIDFKLPEDFVIRDASNPLDAIVRSTYPEIISHVDDDSYFQERAILAPTNEIVQEINDYVMSLLPGDSTEFLSSDSICPDEEDIVNREEVYSVEFLNTIRTSGLPNHIIRVKVGCPIMLLRNIDQSQELCNGTRLIVTAMKKNVIQARQISGKNAGDKVYIPRMLLTPSDVTKFPIRFQRRQFPISVCYAMTINKSQGQSIANVGLYLPNPVFSHGQLYVAFSRVTSKKGLKILALDEEGQPTDITRNVVYKEVLYKL